MRILIRWALVRLLQIVSNLSFMETLRSNVAPTEPHINIQSPPNMTAHPSLPLNRPPPMGALLPNPAPLTHHASAPAMPMAASFTIGMSLLNLELFQASSLACFDRN